jgi:hypothetical protein
VFFQGLEKPCSPHPLSGKLRLADGGGAGIVARMSSRGDRGPTGWQRVRALFEMTPQERLVVWGVLVAALVGLGVRAWVLHRQRADSYQPAGVAAETKDKR